MSQLSSIRALTRQSHYSRLRWLNSSFTAPLCTLKVRGSLPELPIRKEGCRLLSSSSFVPQTDFPSELIISPRPLRATEGMSSFSSPHFFFPSSYWSSFSAILSRADFFRTYPSSTSPPTTASPSLPYHGFAFLLSPPCRISQIPHFLAALRDLPLLISTQWAANNGLNRRSSSSGRKSSRDRPSELEGIDKSPK